MADDFTALAAKFAKVAAVVGPEGCRKIVKAVAAGGKRDYLDEIAADLGADRRMHNWWPPTDSKGRKGPTFGATYKVTSPTEGYIAPKPVGPFSVLDRGRSGGTVVKRGARKGARVAPSRGHGTARRAVTKIHKNTGKRVERQFSKMMMGAMRG
jgi:hypothetical protein